ncbi:MAG: hypothetical protein ACYC61_02350 [Isosphaeraceae bacterium]
MSSRKPDPAVELAQKMLDVFDSRRSFEGAEPPSLQQLGELADPTASPELILKAATKKIFTDRASIARMGRKPALNDAVYPKGQLPKPEDSLARRMISVLEAQRRLGGMAYPPTLRRLAELSETRGPETLIRKAAAAGEMAERTIVTARSGKNAILDAPVVLKDDLERDIRSLQSGLLGYTLSPVVSKTKKGTTETTAFAPAEAVKRFIPELRERIERALAEGIERRELPTEVGWIMVKGKPLLFLTANVHIAAPRAEARAGTHESHAHEPAAAAHHGPVHHHRHHHEQDGHLTPSHDFAREFRSAFEALDRRNGSTNFVKIADLRQALARFTREEFDAGLRELRMDGTFSLDSHEGLHGSLSDDEREAGVREAGSLLVYASRR